nr:MAG TPA: Bacterial alpha-L-rhamnosidase concanavalin-like domain [Caudoviricetes sp.]
MYNKNSQGLLQTKPSVNSLKCNVNAWTHSHHRKSHLLLIGGSFTYHGFRYDDVTS